MINAHYRMQILLENASILDIRNKNNKKEVREKCPGLSDVKQDRNHLRIQIKKRKTRVLQKIKLVILILLELLDLFRVGTFSPMMIDTPCLCSVVRIT